MDPLTQGTVGAVLPQSAFRSEHIRAVTTLGFLAGMAPDLDVFISSDTDPLLFLEFHRQFTHSLIFIPFGAALCAAFLFYFVRNRLSFAQAYLACFLGYATHGLLDACTSYGTQLFWPFTNYRVSWNNMSIVDPAFTLPVLGCVIAAAIRKNPRIAWIGCTWALIYFAIGVIQNQRAEAVGRELAASRGHDPQRLTAKPGFANLLVWKNIYEHDGWFYIDAIRVGWSATTCGGDRARLLDIPDWVQDTPVQAQDIERFRWFSDGYIVRLPEAEGRASINADPTSGAPPQGPDLFVADVRYSILPNKIDPLWGIELFRNAAADQHVRFASMRSLRLEQSDVYMDLVLGEGCN